MWRPFDGDANARRQIGRIAHRQTQPGPLEDHRPLWTAQFAMLQELIRKTLPDQALQVRHVGSTAVPGLVAKPIIDIDLNVPDPTAEATYAPRLEAVGFRLIFRDDVAGDAHRQFTFSDPNANVHVWGPHAIEPRRHNMFSAWLQSDQQDRQRYAEAKQAAVSADGSSRYNDRKAAAIYDIYERIFLADPLHPHQPCPR
ncbi:GrpB family protein [Arthrobacter tecti]